MKYNMIFQLLGGLAPSAPNPPLFKGQLYFNLTRKRIIIILILKVWKLRQREVKQPRDMQLTISKTLIQSFEPLITILDWFLYFAIISRI